MRILVAMMKHETNSFSPVVTDLARFQSWSLCRGEQVVQNYRDTAMPLAAYMELAEQHGAEVVSPLAAEAMPSGLVEQDTYEQLVEWILEPIRAGGIDAVFLDLHGAMTAQHVDDGEGELLRRIRSIEPMIPIAVTLDLHTNLSETMTTHCDAMIGYKTYPHTDMYDVAKQIGKVLWDRINYDAMPIMAWGASPVLGQTLCMGTDDEPMKSLQLAAREAEQNPRILAATVFGGFPMVDVPHAGVSVVVVADHDLMLAQVTRDHLLGLVWDAHEQLIYKPRDVTQSLKQAAQATVHPVVLLDHADNVGSGGTSDVMSMISAVLDSDLEDVAVAAVCDPEAVQQMQRAGLGSTLDISLGGKTDMPSIGLNGEPLAVQAQVINLSDGRWTVRGPMYTGVEVNTGPTAVIRVGSMRIVVTSIHHEPWDAGILSENGIDPQACRYILLKSRIHYRAGFAPIAKATFTLDGIGVTTSDNSLLQYKNLRRPIYPLDSFQDTFK